MFELTRQGALLVGGFHDAVEVFGGVGGNEQEADVIDADQVHVGGPGDGFVDAVIDAVPADEGAEVFHAEPGHGHALIDGLLAECFQEEGFAGAGGPAGDQVLTPPHPFQGPQERRCCRREGGEGLVPDVEGFPGGEAGSFAPGGQHGPVPAGGFEQDADDFGGVPALGFRGGQAEGRGSPR